MSAARLSGHCSLKPPQDSGSLKLAGLSLSATVALPKQDSLKLAGVGQKF